VRTGGNDGHCDATTATKGSGTHRANHHNTPQPLAPLNHKKRNTPSHRELTCIKQHYTSTPGNHRPVYRKVIGGSQNSPQLTIR